MKNLMIALVFFLFNFNAQAQDGNKILPAGLGITTQSHLVSFSGDCFTVWVGVFFTDSEGETILISCGNTQIGACKTTSPITSNPFCKDDFYKGEYIQNSNIKELKYCLIDCLKDDRVYESYQAGKKEILNRIK